MHRKIYLSYTSIARSATWSPSYYAHPTRPISSQAVKTGVVPATSYVSQGLFWDEEYLSTHPRHDETGVIGGRLMSLTILL